MRGWAAALALLLAACGEGAGEGGDVPGANDAATSDDLRGEWVVTSDWGDPFPDPRGIRLSIGETIHMQSQCVEAEWTYSRVGDEVRTRFLPRQTCLRPLHGDEKKVQDRITAGFTILRRQGGVIQWDSGAGPMTVAPAPVDEPVSARDGAEKAAGSRLPQPAEPWPEDLRGEWRLAGIDGKPFDAPYGIAIHVGEDRIDFDNCQQVAWRYGYEAPDIRIERTLAITVDTNPKPAPCAVAFAPGIAAMVAAIDAARQVERTPENGVRLSGGGHSLTLFRQ